MGRVARGATLERKPRRFALAVYIPAIDLAQVPDADENPIRQQINMKFVNGQSLKSLPK